jgi:ectoine hydroxylase-related dioxygenase (phytanoyl-CoA dioxygenase family)
MPDPVTAADVARFHAEGWHVLRGIIPSRLVVDLRRVADQAREVARAAGGPQVQRLQPLLRHPLDERPLREYQALPALRAAVARLLSPAHRHATEDWLGMLFEPAATAWTTGWHRDWRDNSGIGRTRWEAARDDLDLLNQVNAPLYEDGCTWIVPGSHRRDDLPGERAAPAPDTAGLDPVAAERAVREHCLAMPGAMRLQLEPGDVAVYRSTLWHLGAYLPYQRRATLHDIVDHPRYRRWVDETRALIAAGAAAA